VLAGHAAAASIKQVNAWRRRIIKGREGKKPGNGIAGRVFCLFSATMATMSVSDDGFRLIFNHNFSLIGDFVVQTQNMTCLTIRFHADSLILFRVSRTRPQYLPGKRNPIAIAIAVVY